VFSTGFLFYKTWTVSLPNKVSNENRPENYIIQIAGEVLKPGVYQVEEGTRLYQLIELAGGVSPQADISSLNLAAPVHDGLRINIPAQNSNQGQLENSQLSFIGQRPLSEETDSNLVVQINTASLEELKRLPGIGDVIAQRIIEYRKTYGPFQSVEDLINVKGIGTKKLQDIKESISF
jgi:competence protein ComEA